MPQQKVKSSLLAKYGAALQKAHSAHRYDETEYSQFGDLPAGIEGGIAQLVECKFDTYKKGDLIGHYFFYAAGVVVEPKEHADIPIAGLRTSLTEPMCDTPSRGRKTVEEHYQWVLNELRKLGVDTAGMELDDLEATVTALKETAPYFRFRTWKGAKQTTGPYKDQEPRTQHSWGGACEYTPADDGGTGVDDQSDTEVQEEPEQAAPKRTAGPKAGPGAAKGNGKAATKAPNRLPASPPARPAPAPVGKAAKNGPAKGPLARKPAPKEEEPAFDEFGDLDSQAERADAGDDEAQGTLTDLALAAGLTNEDVDNAKSWAALAAMIVEAGEAGADDEISSQEGQEEAPAEWAPEKEEVYRYAPVNPKTRKAGKPVECEVMSVDAASRTASLKNLDDGKTLYKGVKWDQLSAE